jgi:hypothetical protein
MVTKKSRERLRKIREKLNLKNLIQTEIYSRRPEAIECLRKIPITWKSFENVKKMTIYLHKDFYICKNSSSSVVIFHYFNCQLIVKKYCSVNSINLIFVELLSKDKIIFYLAKVICKNYFDIARLVEHNYDENFFRILLSKFRFRHIYMHMYYTKKLNNLKIYETYVGSNFIFIFYYF